MEINLIFHILGIAKTKDEDSIRAAYRQALKNNNPEENPEGFKELRTAYEEALAYAKTSEDEPEDVFTTSSPEIADWLQKVSALYQDLPSRHDLSKWEVLMEDELCQSIDTALEIKEQFIIFLMDHFHFPHEVWQYFDKTFYLLDDMEELRQKFPSDFLDYMKHYIEHPNFLPFSLFSYRNPKDKTCEGDAYIQHYLQIKHKMETEETKECYHLIDQLATFGIYHPYEDVERSRLLLLAGKKTEALALISPLLDKHPNDFYILLYSGVCKWENGEKDSAANLWKQILEERPKYYYAQYYLSQYYFEKELYYDAKDMVISILELYGEDQKALDTLTQINDILITLLSKDLETGNERFTSSEMPIELSWCFFQNHRFEEACSILQDYVPTAKTEYSYYNLYSRVLFQQKRYQEALPLLEKWYSIIRSLKEDGTEETKKRISRLGMASYLLSECYSKLGKLEEAKAILLDQISETNTTTEELEYECHLANIYMKHQLYEQAIDLCDTILSKEKDYYPAYVIRLECFYHLDKGQEVVDDYYRAIELFSSDSTPYVFASEIFYIHRQYEDAKGVLELAKQNQVTFTPRMRLLEVKLLRNSATSDEDILSLIPTLEQLQEQRNNTDCDIEDISEINFEIGRTYQDASQLTEAYNFISDASKENPERLQYKMILGDILIQMKKYQEALELYELGKEQYNSLANYHYNIGVCYDNLHQIENALNSYRMALSIDEGYYDCNEKIADIYNDLYHEQLDPTYLDYAITFSTKQIEADDCCYYRVNRGLIYMNSMIAKYINLAIQDFEIALKYIPDDWAAWNNLGCCYKYLGNFDHAIDCFQKAILNMGAQRSPLPYSNLADCYEALFNYKKAISCYKNNLALFPHTLYNWEEIGDLYSYMGNTIEATKAYKNTDDLKLITDKGIYYCILSQNKIPPFLSIKSYVRNVEGKERARRYHLVGETYFEEKGNYERALTYYQKALEYPLDSKTLIHYETDCALAFYMLKQFENAKIHAQRALKAFQSASHVSYKSEEYYCNYAPYSPARYGTLGLIYMILGDKDKALLLFSRMESGLRCKNCRFPGCYEQQLYLGHYYNLMGDKSNALLHYNKAIELNPHCTIAKIEQKKLLK